MRGEIQTCNSESGLEYDTYRTLVSILLRIANGRLYINIYRYRRDISYYYRRAKLPKIKSLLGSYVSHCRNDWNINNLCVGNLALPERVLGLIFNFETVQDGEQLLKQ